MKKWIKDFCEEIKRLTTDPAQLAQGAYVLVLVTMAVTISNLIVSK